MRKENVRTIGPAMLLLLSLGACGGHSDAPGRQVAAIPGATTSARAATAASNGDDARQLPLGATKEEIKRAYDAYYACWTQHGVPSDPAAKGGGPLLSYKKDPKKYQPAVDACADKEPLSAPELDPHQNPNFADDLRKELQCDRSHGLSMEIRQAGTDDAGLWVAPDTKANLDKVNSDAGVEIQRQCEISAFTQK